MIDASPAGLTAVWERAVGLPPADRACVLLELSVGSSVDIDAWTLGRCDARLATIFRAIFGDAVEATVRCDQCRALLEFETTIRSLFGSGDVDLPQSGAFCIRQDAYEIVLRPLCVGDIAALPASSRLARESLLDRCVIAARRDGCPVANSLLPGAVVDAVSRALNDADPLATIDIGLLCAACGCKNGVRFDIATYLFEALDVRVAQTARDVHVLATAYGWSESHIFALPDLRLRRYLELCGA